MDEGACGSARVPGHGLLEDVEKFRRRGNVDESTPAGHENPPHFFQGSRTIGEKLERELTEHYIKGSVRQRHRFGRRFVPLNRIVA